MALQHFAFVSIGVDYFQILAMFGNSKVTWPPAIVTLFRLMSSLSFNLDITAPECSLPNLSYANKWCVSAYLWYYRFVHTASAPRFGIGAPACPAASGSSVSP
jgi:hypothetical protein